MKQIGEPRTTTQPNGWGQDSTSTCTTFEIEESDLGPRPNYLGHGNATIDIRYEHIGRRIFVYTGGHVRHGGHTHAWTCWVWATP